jgi:hypothetical protein
MAWYDFLIGSRDKFKQIPTIGKGQQQALDAQSQGLSGLSPQIFSYLQDLFSNNSQSQQNFAAPFMRQFNEQTVPGLAETFGGVGALSSSGFQNALGQAGAGLQENLAALREQSRGQGLNAFQGLMGQNLSAKPFENVFMQGQQGLLQPLLSGLASSFGGPLGGGIASWLSSLLGGGSKDSRYNSQGGRKAGSFNVANAYKYMD